MSKQQKNNLKTCSSAFILAFLGTSVFYTQLVNAQARVRPELEESSEIKIYQSIESLVADKPDTVIQSEYLMKPVEFGIVEYHLLVTKKEGDQIGQVYGFKIGNETFINPKSPKLRKNKAFYKTERIGGYINYATVGVVWFAPGRGLGPNRITYPREELVRMNDGKTLHLTRDRLKRILKKENNMVLLEEFKSEMNKSDKLISYLKYHELRKGDS